MFCRAAFQIFLVFSSLTQFAIAEPNLTKWGEGWYEERNGVSILHLKGTDYEMGQQYGYFVGDKIENTISRLREIAAAQTSDARLIPSPVFQWARRAVGFVMWYTFPKIAKEQLKGIRSGAKKREPPVDLNIYDLALINSVIDLAGLFRAGWTSPTGRAAVTAGLKVLGLENLVTNCNSMAVWGSRTKDGKTFQTRNVDISTGQGLEDFPVVILAKPKGEIPYISAAFAGMVGVFTGMNAKGVALGQIWTFSKDVVLTTPWPLTFLSVFRKASTALEATEFAYEAGPYVYGNNFVIADAGTVNTPDQTGYVLEASGRRVARFDSNDRRELQSTHNGQPYGLPLKEAVLRADLQLDPKLRRRQLGSNGPDGDPRTSGAYRDRYLGQYQRIKDYEARGVRMTHAEAEAISRETAMRGTSLQTAVYANTDRSMWVSYAKKNPKDGKIVQAYDGTYHEYPFYKFLLSAVHKDSSLIFKSWIEKKTWNIRADIIRDGVVRGSADVIVQDGSVVPFPRGELQTGDSVEIYNAETGELIEVVGVF